MEVVQWFGCFGMGSVFVSCYSGCLRFMTESSGKFGLVGWLVGMHGGEGR